MQWWIQKYYHLKNCSCWLLLLDTLVVHLTKRHIHAVVTFQGCVPNGMRLDHVDLAVLICSDHILYDFGTFSFWAGALTKGHAFLPRRYYNMEHIEVALVGEIVKSNMMGGRFHFIDEL